jgi:hypothetical protein
MRKAFFLLSLGAVALGLASCSDSPAQPNVTPTPIVPTATPAPTPNPGPTPKARPTPPPIPPNTNPVARVGIQIETVTCNGVPQKSNTSWDEVPVGCKMYFDTTPKDAQNQRTTPANTPVWTFDPPKLVDVNYADPYTPIAMALDPGDMVVIAEVDGIKSQPLTVKLKYFQ